VHRSQSGPPTAPPWQGLSELLQHWSGAVMCPACLCGSEAAGPNALRGSGPTQNTEEGFRLAHLTPLAPLCSLSRQRVLPRQGVCLCLRRPDFGSGRIFQREPWLVTAECQNRIRRRPPLGRLALPMVGARRGIQLWVPTHGPRLYFTCETFPMSGIGTSRQFGVTHRVGRYWGHSGQNRIVALTTSVEVDLRADIGRRDIPQCSGLLPHDCLC
jgi:hypothetical protein